MSMPTLYAGGTSEGSQHGPHIAALQSTRVWLALDPDGAGTACVSPGNLMQSQVQNASDVAEMWLKLTEAASQPFKLLCPMLSGQRSHR